MESPSRFAHYRSRESAAFVKLRAMSKTSKNKPRKIGVALYGAGTVGGAVLAALKQNHQHYAESSGVVFDVRHVVTRKKRTGPWPYTTSLQKPLQDPAVEMVVEVMGGETDALDVIRQGLATGRAVVTANKAVLAKHAEELFTTPGCHNAQGQTPLYFEASVAGGIPVIGPVTSSLRSSLIHRLIGILNGTCNYILTRMQNEGAPLEDALKQAQALGYAEADASFDVDGHDALHKLTILAMLVSGRFVDWRKLHREGIGGVAARDITYACELGYRIKLLAMVQQLPGGKLDARVHPALLPLAHPLAHVDGVLNGIYLQAEPLGPLMLVGRGAGGGPTAASVIADMLAAATSPPPPLHWHGHASLLPAAEITSRFYLRLTVKDKTGVLAATSQVFSAHAVGIHSLIQKGVDAGEAEMVWITHAVTEKNLRAALREIRQQKIIKNVASVIRVEDAPAG